MNTAINPKEKIMPSTAEHVRPEIHIHRPDPGLPILSATGRDEIRVRAGTAVTIGERTHAFDTDTPVAIDRLTAGRDYAVAINADGNVFATIADTNPLDGGHFSGFHYAPGGNAPARSGGDDVPAINPFSIWDLGFRPSCDPRGMVCVELTNGHRVWVDIYLLGADHTEHGTSRFGAEIADGVSLDRLDYSTAVDILAGHGKRLMTYDEFRIAAFGVTERSSASRDPKKTGIDAARTSRFGLMQATGNLWIWSTDGDPDDPRPSVLGGSWLYGDNAGSRFARLGSWADDSSGRIGCRGACDYL